MMNNENEKIEKSKISVNQILNEVLTLQESVSENSVKDLKLTIQSQKLSDKNKTTIESLTNPLKFTLESQKIILPDSDVKLDSIRKLDSQPKSNFYKTSKKDTYSRVSNKIQKNYLISNPENQIPKIFKADKSNKWIPKQKVKNLSYKKSKERLAKRSISPVSRNYSKENTISHASIEIPSKVKMQLENPMKSNKKVKKKEKKKKKNYMNQYLRRRNMIKKSILPNKVKKKHAKKADSKLMSLYMTELENKSKKKIKIFSEKAQVKKPNSRFSSNSINY